MRVRILRIPQERELDGVRLDLLSPGMVRDVSASIATWLVAQGYAQLEMRHSEEDDFTQDADPHRPTGR